MSVLRLNDWQCDTSFLDNKRFYECANIGNERSTSGIVLICNESISWQL